MSNKRLSDVKTIRIHSIAYSSIFNIGDSNNANPRSKIIALQQEGAIFNDAYDVQFEDYPIFQLQPNWPNGRRNVKMRSRHHSNTIRVGNVYINGASQSGIIQVGSLKHIHSDSRVKHFRRIRSEKEEI
ncbi:spore germination protein PE [Oceanobacillus limi]|uniref:Spore germination protein PE n=1 Tax=Oceanobacillus limi TaxID=930131 RepID=A0A1I0C5M1_9BACI|nr:spore germination protein GerPE [Oceanobacillus limi]SET14050.1 spore germination protein PE [Oceanobacillus limi]